MQHDEGQIGDFLAAHFGTLAPGETIEIRAFSSGGGAKRERGFFTDAREAARWIARKVDPRLEVYYGVNPRLGDDGTKEGVSRILYAWADLDFKHFSSPEEAMAVVDGFDLPPTVIVHTGGGAHLYWRLRAGLDATENRSRMEAMLTRLYYRLGKLDAVQDLSRVLRVPGTWNNKGEYGQPKAVRRVFHDASAAYTIEEFEKCLPILPVSDRSAPTRIYTASENGNTSSIPSPDEMATILSFIPPTLPYSEYLSIWMGVASAYPDEQGLALMDAWSSEARAANGQYSSPRTQPEKHRQFRRQGVGIGTVIHYAKQGGYIPPSPPVPQIVRRSRVEPYRAQLAELRDPPVDELPHLYGRIYDYLADLTEPFDRDFTTGMIAAAFSTLLPNLRFENLNLALWFMGVAGQSAGKNALSDALFRLITRVDRPLEIFDNGTAEGMWRELDGDNKQLLCYHREYGDFLASMGRDYMSGAKGALCNLYDGAPVNRLLSKTKINATNPYVTVLATTTQQGIAKFMAADDLKTGYVSRFLIPFTDARNVSPRVRDSETVRRELALLLTERARELAKVEWATWDTARGEEPEAYRQYKVELGVGTGEVRRFEDEIGRVEVPQGRLLARVKKLAANLEAAESAPQVRGNCLFIRDSNCVLAILLVRRWALGALALYPLVTSSKDEALIATVLRYLAEGRPVTRGELLRATHAETRDLTRILDFLTDEETISSEWEGRKVRYTLTGRQ